MPTHQLSIITTMLTLLLGLGFAQIGPQDIPNGIMPNKRQAAGTGVTPSSSPTTSIPPTTSNSSPTQSSTPTHSTTANSSPTQSTSVVVHVSSTSVPTTVKVTTTNADGSTTTSEISTNTVSKHTTTETRKNSFVTLGSTTINAGTLSHKTTVRSPLVTTHKYESTYTSRFTHDGTVGSSVFTSTGERTSTTGFSTHTIDPSLADGGGSGSNLSTNTKSVIGGVVGGVGGAVVVGALAFVLFRVRGNRKKQTNVDDYNDAMSKSNRDSSMTFGSEGYSHVGRVNTASNF